MEVGGGLGWGAAGEGKKPGGEGARGSQVPLHEEDTEGDGAGLPPSSCHPANETFDFRPVCTSQDYCLCLHQAHASMAYCRSSLTAFAGGVYWGPYSATPWLSWVSSLASVACIRSCHESVCVQWYSSRDFDALAEEQLVSLATVMKALLCRFAAPSRSERTAVVNHQVPHYRLP